MHQFHLEFSHTLLRKQNSALQTTQDAYALSRSIMLPAWQSDHLQAFDRALIVISNLVHSDFRFFSPMVNWRKIEKNTDMDVVVLQCNYN